MKQKKLILGTLLAMSVTPLFATPVKITMNAVSTTMSLASKENGETVDVGTPVNKVYEFETDPGTYILSAYGTDSQTVNGTIELKIADSGEEQSYSVITCTAYVTNTTGGTQWSSDAGDYELDVTVWTREGERQIVEYGKSTTPLRNTFLALNGNSYNVAFIPSETHASEGFTTLYKAGTLTSNTNIYGAIPTAEYFTASVPEDAELEIGLKFTHFTDFTRVKPISVEKKDGTKKILYSLANGQVYNYRTWKEGGITYGGYFTMNSDPAKCPNLDFTEDDYKKYDPKAFNHDVNSNSGYETGDILMNINAQGYLRMTSGEEFKFHGMRMWETTDNMTNNYFIEPEFHYTVLTLEGNKSSDVVEITHQPSSAWASVKALGKGTAIVLVSYDGMCLNYYSGATKNPYMGGEYWGAIWPENTGVFVVTVDEPLSSVESNMVINEEYNQGALKLSGNCVDAEHDVFYFLDTTEGYVYNFKPENAEKVEIAYPSFEGGMANYTGFSELTQEEDGSYSIMLKHGRQIVRMSDSTGHATYQILTAKKCHREITNDSRPSSKIFQPGDKVKIQYSGLYHPANKIAGIYNMSAYITYNDIPNGSSLIMGSGQYTFASAPSAQAVTIEIPEDYDGIENPEIKMDRGVIQVNGFGDPIGNHRNTSPIAGRSANFTAVAHKTYFGSLPDVKIPVTPVKKFLIVIDCEIAETNISITADGKEIIPDEEGYYNGTYGDYLVTVKKEGFRCFRHVFNIPDDAEGLQTFVVELEEGENLWDGITMTEPEKDSEGTYQISSGAHLAWLANYIDSNKNTTTNSKMLNDIDLGDYDWCPIGVSSTYAFGGRFDGQGYHIKGLYISQPSSKYQGLFGYAKNATVSNLEVEGSVSGQQYVGGVLAYAGANTAIDRCANHAEVNGSSTYVGGVVGYLSVATASISNSYNTGNVTGTTNCGGVAGSNNMNSEIKNIFNVGEVKGTTTGGCVGGTTAKNKASNVFTLGNYAITNGQESVTPERMASGEIAHKLGEAFGQEIGVDSHPVFGGMKVYYDEGTDTYSNGPTGIADVDGTAVVPHEYINLQGESSSRPWKGFNIVKMSDGTVKKMVF